MSFKIDFCHKTRKEDVKKFLGTHWIKNHILSFEDSLFDWQHKNENDNYNFVIAINDKTNEIIGLQGFIPVYQFSKYLKNNREIWGAVWKIREDAGIPGLGLHIQKHMLEKTHANSVYMIGLSEVANKIYNRIGFSVNSMKHYVLPNNQVKQSKIAVYGKVKVKLMPTVCQDYKLVKSDKDELIKKRNVINKQLGAYRPQKDVDYIINRYINHPIYHYDVFTLQNEESILGVVVFREIKVDNQSVLLIIDYLGNHQSFARSFYAMYNLLQSRHAEYISFMQYGMSEHYLHQAGFLDTNDIEDGVFPIYFEPFLKKNITINFAYKLYDKNNEKSVFICKGDGDQDRPNRLT